MGVGWWWGVFVHAQMGGISYIYNQTHGFWHTCCNVYSIERIVMRAVKFVTCLSMCMFCGFLGVLAEKLQVNGPVASAVISVGFMFWCGLLCGATSIQERW